MSVLDYRSAQGQELAFGGYTPLRTNKETGEVVLHEEGNFRVNSILRREEWLALQDAVKQIAEEELTVISDLRSAGLAGSIGSEGTLVSQWLMGSDVSDAQVDMTGRTRSDGDLQELKSEGVPVPIFYRDFDIGRRFLMASRQSGQGIDVTNAQKATRAVRRLIEDAFFTGTSIVFQGRPMYGVLNHPNRLTDTASNYGGGDFGTIANVVPTFAGMINALNGIDRYGQVGFYVSYEQYNQMAMSYYTDGSGATPLQRVMALPQVGWVRPMVSNRLAAGNVVGIHLAADEVMYRETRGITPLEWTSNDGMVHSFKIMSICTFEIKSDYNDTLGIVHATGA